VLATSATLGCASKAPPSNIHDGCVIFDEKHGWYEAAKDSERRWGTPVPVQLAIIHQESKFDARAKPRRMRILGFIPGPRPSTAYGYAQALSTTWQSYVDETGNWGASRTDFSDATDFVGWYTARTSRVNRISRADAYNLYLAYHDGDAGYRRGTYKRKPWLLATARKVAALSSRYRAQLTRCEAALAKRSRGWFSWSR
jgi:hypothetical protein